MFHFSSLIIVQIRFSKTDREVLIETQDDFFLYSYDFAGFKSIYLGVSYFLLQVLMYFVGKGS